MHEYEFYLLKEIEESDRKEDFMNRKREELENAANSAIKEDGSNEVSGKHEEEKEAV